jgi:hypothetical protein
VEDQLRQFVRSIIQEKGPIVSREYKAYKGSKKAGADDPEAMAAAATIAIKGKPASKDE